VEHYTFTGSVGVDFTGNELDNRIAGTIAADTIDGADGSDTLLGDGGADLLVGGKGNDSLDGGVGSDTLDGGAGDDIYVLDGPTDQIIDSGGFDAVIVGYSIDLATGGFKGIEEVVLGETGNLDVIGNATSNEIVGNSFANHITGLAGNDTLDGWVGDDSLDGGVGNDFLLGFYGDDTLVGGAGIDALVGEQGNDLLLGGAGADAYGYDSLVDGADVVETGDKGVDRIFLFGSDLWDWDFDRIGNDLLITALVDASDVYDPSRTIRIVDQYAGAGIAYFEGDFGTDGNLFYGGNPDLTRVYTPGTLTGKNQGANAELIAGTPDDDKIVGNGGQSDWLYGGGGNDSIVGGSTAGGLAWLFGNAGNDTLGGGSGNNRLSGGDGDDLYIVDSAGDSVNELGSDANDELRTNQVLSGVVANIEHTRSRVRPP
jgi:Ca2+-binding RTX toxin-like protein